MTMTISRNIRLASVGGDNFRTIGPLDVDAKTILFVTICCLTSPPSGRLAEVPLRHRHLAEVTPRPGEPQNRAVLELLQEMAMMA